MKLDRLLPSFSLKRPVTVLMVFLALLTLGLLAFQRIPYEMMPQGFESPYMGFWVPYPDSTPEEVEDRIARPFEENLRSIHGLRYLESYSQSHGCWIWIQMRDGTDMNQAWSQVRDRIDRSLAETTVVIERVVLRRMGMDDEEVYWMGFSSDLELPEARILLEEYIQKSIEHLDGVANVQLWGGDSREVLVDLDLEALGRHGVSSWEVVQRLMGDNFALSCGQVYEGRKRLPLRVDARWREPDEIARIPVTGGRATQRAENAAGAGAGRVQLQVADLARVHLGVPDTHWAQRIDRRPALLMGVAKESTANTERLCRRIDELLRAAEKDPRLASLNISPLFSQGRFIRESIDNLKESAIWGGIFALFVLFFFLRRWTSTLVVTAAIPFCIFIAVTVIYFAGWSLNIITMMGLMISVGMVVDNAIVVMESISITASNGRRGESCIAGTAEVSLAVTVATLTSIVVFLPLMLMTGEDTLSFFLMRIGMPVVIALLASLLVALLFIPQLSSRLSVTQARRESRLIRWGRNHVRSALEWCLRRRVDATLLALLALASMGIPMSQVEKVGEGEGHVNDFHVRLSMPSSYSMEDAGDLVRRIEDLVYEQEETYGLKTITSRHSNTWGRVHVWLATDARQSWYEYVYRRTGETLGLFEHRRLTRDEVIEDLKERLPEPPGVEIRIGWSGHRDERSITLLMRGTDTEVLRDLSREAQRRLELLPEVAGTELDVERGDEELRFAVDREALQRQGMSAGELASTVRYALSGSRIGYLQRSDRDVPIRVRLAEKDRDQLHKLGQLEVKGRSDVAVPLGNLVEISHGKALGTIRRSQGRTFMRIRVFTESGEMEQIRESIRGAFENFNLPAGYSWSLGRGFDRYDEQSQSQQQALMLAICFVFLLMGMLFESFAVPFTILAAIPFAFFGAWWALFLTGTPFDIMAAIGLIILVGVVVNNAIVLVDLVVRLRREGLERREALLEACSRRFRPVMMTALTTICGLIPMAVGNAALVGMPYAPMGRAMAGGLLTSTLFTLLVIPLLYTWVDDGAIYLRALFWRVFRRKETGA